jgi:hypothetical protein
MGDVSQTAVRMRVTIPPLLARGVTVLMILVILSPVYLLEKHSDPCTLIRIGSECFLNTSKTEGR